MMAMCLGIPAWFCTVTNLKAAISFWARYRPFAQQQSFTLSTGNENLLGFKSKFARLALTFALHHTQALHRHAKLLRLPEQIDQHKRTGFAIVGDVFAL